MVSLPHISSLHALYPELFQQLQHGAIHTSRQPPTQENLQPALSRQRQPGAKTARHI